MLSRRNIWRHEMLRSYAYKQIIPEESWTIYRRTVAMIYQA